jgi:hypothetical protein
MNLSTALLVALAALVPAVASAQVGVRVDIGIHLPAPPQLVVVPQVPAVRYVPAPPVPGNLFFYGGQYWAFVSGVWHVSAGYNGPWIVVAPQYVPRPVLLVPVRYYHVPPGHWKQWERSRPPHWSDEWGREWADKRDWKPRDRDGDRGPKPGKGKGRGQGHGR